MRAILVEFGRNSSTYSLSSVTIFHLVAMVRKERYEASYFGDDNLSNAIHCSNSMGQMVSETYFF